MGKENGQFQASLPRVEITPNSKAEYAVTDKDFLFKQGFTRRKSYFEKKTVSLKVGQELEEGGVRASAQSISILDQGIEGGETTEHELDHVLGTDPDNVAFVTIIPDSDSLGKTKYHSPDPVGAVAAHAKGRRGTGWDMFMATRMLRGHTGSAESAALTRMSSNEIYRPVLAFKLEKNKSLTGGEVKETILEVNQEVTLGKKTEVEVQLSDGTTEKRVERAKNNIVTLELETRVDEECSSDLIPKAA
jgi:hypothetical protein